jgi:predicted ATP-grasp superfamily ATP-dependent carboligase
MRRALDAMYRRLGYECVLFPTTDTAVLTLAGLYHTLKNHCIVMPDRETVESMVIKTKFYRSLHNSGIPYPETFDPTETSLTELARSVTFPVYVRPAQTLLFSQYFRGKGFVARTRREMLHYIELTQKHHVDVMVQQIIPGPTENGYIVKGYFTRHGALNVLITKQKVWQPSMFANSSISVTIPRAHVAAFSHPFLTWMIHRRYRGLFGAEFKRDARDGTVKLLEVNARSTGDSFMGRVCGADDIFAAYCDALENVIPSRDKYQVGVHYINEVASLQTIVNRIAHGQSSHLGDLGRILSNKYLHLFSRNDPLPTTVRFRQILKQLRARL